MDDRIQLELIKRTKIELLKEILEELYKPRTYVIDNTTNQEDYKQGIIIQKIYTSGNIEYRLKQLLSNSEVEHISLTLQEKYPNSPLTQFNKK
jgi:hypothetical protein